MNAPTQRLFFALWPPDDSLRQGLETVRAPWLARAKGRAVDLSNLHLTLAFIGDVAATLAPRLSAEADKIEGAAFELTLDCLGNWRHNGILWAGAAASSECAALQRLVRALRQVLRDCGLKPDKRPYQAHVTLARNFFHGPVEPLPIPPLAWPVRDFVLVDSRRVEGRQVYEVIRRWPLRGE